MLHKVQFSSGIINNDMTVIRPNSISGITSITSHQNDVAFYKSDSTGANINNISIHSPSGIITAASIDIGSDIKLGNSGVVTATSYRGDGHNFGITGTTINTMQKIELLLVKVANFKWRSKFNF